MCIRDSYHLSLRSDRGVIGAWHPASVVTRNASTTDEYVLDRVIEHVPHVPVSYTHLPVPTVPAFDRSAKSKGVAGVDPRLVQRFWLS